MVLVFLALGISWMMAVRIWNAFFTELHVLSRSSYQDLFIWTISWSRVIFRLSFWLVSLRCIAAACLHQSFSDVFACCYLPYAGPWPQSMEDKLSCCHLVLQLQFILLLSHATFWCWIARLSFLKSCYFLVGNCDDNVWIRILFLQLALVDNCHFCLPVNHECTTWCYEFNVVHLITKPVSFV